MSPRDDTNRRRRERSWERDSRGRDRSRDRDRERIRDRDRDRDWRVSDYHGGHSSGSWKRDGKSRSRSPRRDDRRGYERERGHDRRAHDRSGENKRDYEREEKRDQNRRGLGRDHDREHKDGRSEADKKLKSDERRAMSPNRVSGSAAQPPSTSSEIIRPTEDEQLEPGEEYEPIDAQDEEVDLMAMMGFGGFDSTKGKPVQGNQEGAVNIKKPRTWRQYMNRRGGFNRPLDKIK